MDVPIMRAQIYSRVTNEGLQTLGGGERGYTEGVNTLYSKGFVIVDANQALAMAIAVSTGPVSAGASPTASFYMNDASSTDTTVNPPYTMFGDTDNSGATFQKRHWPELLKGMRFAMNITGTTFQVGTAGSAPTLSNANCIVGKQLPLIVGGTSTPSSGAYAGFFAVNVGSTTNPMVEIMDIPQRYRSINQSTRATAYNGIVIVRFLDSIIAAN